MKVLVDAGFPPLDDIRCIAMGKELYKRKRRYAYKVLKNNTVYFYFPRVNIFTWLYVVIVKFIAKRLKMWEPVE